MKEYEAIYFYFDNEGNKVAVGGIEYGPLVGIVQPRQELYERLISKLDMFDSLFVDIIGVGCYKLERDTYGT